jgi:tetratricopeptide (TPR) repeat protein
MSTTSAGIVVLALACAATALGGQEPTRIEGLGALSFPNSGAAEAQEPFVRGVLLLHSFQYDEAAEAFQEAQSIDPDFAMAYWGEAMTYTHPVWDEKDGDAARAALARLAPTPEARQGKAATEREKDWLRAVETLYGEGEKERLDTLYSREMARLLDRYPEDLEVQTFYALSLLGLSQGNRDVPTYMEAGALALDAFEKNPDHPGAAHYTIHSFDDPTHAVLAMEAAEAYGPMARDAAHAQHMTTHIFLARGLWDRVVEANIRADAVVDRSLAARGLPPTDCGHYNQWLMYGYQQQGRLGKAEALLAGCWKDALDQDLPAGRRRSAGFSVAYMRNLFLADAGRVTGPAEGLRAPEGDAVTAYVRASFAWGAALEALEAGDRAAAERHQAVFEDAVEQIEPSWVSPYAPVWQGTLEAMILADAGDLPAALAAAGEAADYEASLPVDFGPPIAYKPARELVGELLLEMDRPGEAMGAFDMALERTPNRIHSLAGYARAAAAAGRDTEARDAYARLVELLDGADPGMAVAGEARRYLEEEIAGSGG